MRLVGRFKQHNTSSDRDEQAPAEPIRTKIARTRKIGGEDNRHRGPFDCAPNVVVIEFV